MTEKPLKPRQKKFADEYLISGNASASACSAGYSEKGAKSTGFRLLRLPNVSAYIEGKRAELAQKKGITLERLAEQFEQDRAFAISTKNATAAVRASEMLAKLGGLMVDRKDHRVLGQYHVIIEGLSK